MRAVFIKEFGGAEQLEIREVSDPPKPRGGAVLIKVKAAGLNRADIMQRLGKYPPPAGHSPNMPGLEFSGEVAETGDEVENFRSGDRVFGIVAGEAQAEYLITDERLLSRIPERLNYVEAAAVPEVFITAHDAVFTQCGLRPDEWLLIHAIGSGVGLAALQLAKANGAFVAGTSRTQEKLDRCREFGLDLPLHTPKPIFAKDVRAKTGAGVGVVLDLVGGDYFAESLASLAVKGRLILVGLTAGRTSEIDLGMALSKRARIIGTVLRARSLEEKAAATEAFAKQVIPLFDAGRIRPNLDRVFAIDDIQEAHRYLESNQAFGKVVVEL